MSRRRPLKWIIGLGLCVGIAGGGGLLLVAPTAWVSDPTAVRPWSDWEKVMNPAQPAPLTINSNILESLTISTNARQQLQLTYTASRTGEAEHLNWKVVRADASLKADLGDGSITIEYLGIAYGGPVEVDDDGDSLELEGRFFRPDGTPFEPADYQRCELREWDRKLRYRNGFPAVKIGLKLDGIPGYKLLGLRAFDARTHAPLGAGGYSHGGEADRYRIETSLAIWHPAPVELVLDLAVGPDEVFEFPARQGTFQTFPTGAIALAAMVDGEERSWSSSGDGKTDTFTLGFEQNAENPQCSFVFLCQPRAHPAPIDLELLDAEGKALPSAGGGSSDRVMVKSVRARIEEVASVRVRYHPTHRRLLFHLPELCGLPPENAALANLFDLQLPYVKLHYEHSLQDWVEKVLQLKVDASTRPTYPTGAFPMAFTNVTAADIFQVWMSHHPPGLSARVNPETQTIEVRKSGATELLERVRKWLAGKFK